MRHKSRLLLFYMGKAGGFFDFTQTHTDTLGRARTFLNKAGSNLHHVFKEVEMMKSLSTSVDSQISS